MSLVIKYKKKIIYDFLENHIYLVLLEEVPKDIG